MRRAADVVLSVPRDKLRAITRNLTRHPTRNLSASSGSIAGEARGRYPPRIISGQRSFMARLEYRFFRLKLATLGLVPRTRLARITAYLAAIDLFFYVLHGAFALSGSIPSGRAALTAWVPFPTFWGLV